MFKGLGILICLFVTVMLAVKIYGNAVSKQANNVEGVNINKIDPLLNEASDMSRSNNDYWWLNSGGKVFIDDNSIKTIQGDLPDKDPWQVRYEESNPTETDNGHHPQNIFRLVTRQKYQNFSQTMYFKVNRYILSEDSRRAASNGVLFFHHYLDGDNLYYAGFRVDGNAVIKKKYKGTYYTMVYQPVFPGEKYNRESNPNLMPVEMWLGIKSEIVNIDSRSVSIKLYIDKDGTGNWQLAAEAVDNGKTYGGKAILSEGYAGIRSDFMDAEFKDYKATEISTNNK